MLVWQGKVKKNKEYHKAKQKTITNTLRVREMKKSSEEEGPCLMKDEVIFRQATLKLTKPTMYPSHI